MVTPKSTTISLDSGSVYVEQIGDDVIHRTVKDVAIAKINWSENLARVQRQLEAEKVKGQQLQAEKVKSQQQLAEEKVKGQQQLQAEKVIGQQQLQAEKRRAEAELAALYHTHQEEKTRERERVKRFYIGIQQKKTSLLKQVMKRIEEKDVLSKLVQQLCEEFDVRLLAIDSGLRFLMDVPVEEWKGVKELQEKLRKVLEDALLPKQEKEEVTWTEVTSCNMKRPRQVCTDPSGNVYIACSDSGRVLVMSADGRWRRLLEGSQHGDGRRVWPYAVCVTGSRLVVSWHEYRGYSVVTGYDLKK
nr:hypothetical protein BaRGS_022081 [Batillaria attramentaria]